MNVENSTTGTLFTLMPYAMSERGERFRAAHKYKKLSQIGNVVEYEFQFCDDEECSCRQRQKESAAR
jgi:hypothetical protein